MKTAIYKTESFKTVTFRFQTIHSFSRPVSGHRFLLKILPRSDSRQHIKTLSWNVEPKSALWRTKDGLGNAALAGLADEPHSHFIFGVKGEAQVTNAPYIKHKTADRIYRCPSGMTRVGDKLNDFYESLLPGAPRDTQKRLEYFSHAVHAAMEYVTGATNINTTAAEAFVLSKGVCQDYAHILLVLLRLNGIPSRYVAGFGSDYGESHAWVEAHTKGRYYGLDPTRDKLIDENYIAVSRGRDSKDCSIERGIYKGVCTSQPMIQLDMEVYP